MPLRILFLSFFLACSLTMLAQPDSLSVEALITRTGEWRFTQLDTALMIGRTAVAAAEQLPFERLRAKAAYQLALVFADIHQLDSALHFGHQARHWMEQLDWDFGRELSLNLLGAAHRSLGRQDSAVYYLEQSFAVAAGIADSLGMAYALNNLGNIFFDADDPGNARSYYQRALPLARRQQPEDPFLLNNVLTNLASVTTGRQRYTYLLEARAQSQRSADSSNLVFVYQSLGGYFESLDRPSDSAAFYFQASYQLALVVGDPFSAVAAANGLAGWYLTVDDDETAGPWVERALALSREVEATEQRLLAHRHFATWLRRHGRSEQALAHLDTALWLQDTLYQQRQAEALAEANARFALADKDRLLAEQALDLSQQQLRLRNGWIIGLAILLAFGLVFGWLWRRQSRRKRAAEQQAAIRTAEVRQLQALDELKTRFFTNISHDLRTPLTLILGPLAELKDSLLDQPRQRLLEVASEAGEQLLHRVNDLLDLARLEAGQLQPHSRPLAVLPWLRRVVLAFESLANVQGVHLRIESDLRDEQVAELDADKAAKIVQNLISNALKYTPTGGEIVCRLQWTGSVLELGVQDTGPGIPPHIGARVFDRYYRAPDQVVEGVGVGLALSRELAEVLGGQLDWVDNGQPGACFRLRLPAEPSAEKVAPVVEEEQVTAAVMPVIPGGTIKVLIVEDQPDMADYLAHLLGSRHRVLLAANGQAALRQLQTQQVDLILSDVMMPGMDGLTFRERVQANGRWREIPFIFLTARSLDVHRLEGLRLGVDDYLLKPFRPAELLARIDNVLLARQRRGPETVTSSLNAQEAWWRQAHQLAADHLGEPGFNVAAWAKALGCSTRHLARQSAEATGLTPVAYLLEMRLQQAYHYLSTRRFFTVAEVGYAVGIESASYLSRKFLERFGVRPSELLASPTKTS